MKIIPICSKNWLPNFDYNYNVLFVSVNNQTKAIDFWYIVLLEHKILS